MDLDMDCEVKVEPDSDDEDDCMIEMEIFNDCAAIKKEFIEAEGLAAAIIPQVKQETDDRKDWFHNGKEQSSGFEINSDQPLKAEGVGIPIAVIKLHRLEDLGYQISNVTPVEEPVKVEPDSDDEDDCMIEMEIFNDCAAIKKEFEAEGLASANIPQVKQEPDDRNDCFHYGKEQSSGFKINSEQPFKAEGVGIPIPVIKLHRLEDLGYQISNVTPVEEPVKVEPDSEDEDDCMIEMEIFNDCAAIKKEFEAEGLASANIPQVKQEPDDRNDCFHYGKEQSSGFKINSEQPFKAEGVGIPIPVIKLHRLEDLGYQISNVTPVEEPVKVEPDSEDEDDCMIEMEIFNDCAAIKKEFEAEGLASANIPQVKQETDDRKDWFHNGKEQSSSFKINSEQPLKAEGVAIPIPVIKLYRLEDLGYQISNVTPVEEPVPSSYYSSLAEEEGTDTEEEEELTERKEYIVKCEDSLEDEEEEEDDDVDDPEPEEQSEVITKEIEQEYIAKCEDSLEDEEEDDDDVDDPEPEEPSEVIAKEIEQGVAIPIPVIKLYRLEDLGYQIRNVTPVEEPVPSSYCSSLAEEEGTDTEDEEEEEEELTERKEYIVKCEDSLEDDEEEEEEEDDVDDPEPKEQSEVIANDIEQSQDEGRLSTTRKDVAEKGASKKMLKRKKSHCCIYCNYRTSRKSHLDYHERTHTGEKPYKCKICNKKFSRPYTLIVHERTHSGKKPYKCTTCNKKFSLKHHLIDHERTHSGEKPYKCTTCNKKFSRKHHLIDHERTHSGEKPFKCTTCNKKFSDRRNMNRHEITHSGVNLINV